MKREHKWIRWQSIGRGMHTEYCDLCGEERSCDEVLGCSSARKCFPWSGHGDYWSTEVHRYGAAIAGDEDDGWSWTATVRGMVVGGGTEPTKHEAMKRAIHWIEADASLVLDCIHEGVESPDALVASWHKQEATCPDA